MDNLAESSDRNEASDGHQLGAFKQLQFHKSAISPCNRALPKPLQSWHNSVLIVTTAVHRLQATRHMRGFAMRQSLVATALPAMHPPARNLGPTDNKRQLIRQSLEIEEKRLNLKPTKVATVGNIHHEMGARLMSSSRCLGVIGLHSGVLKGQLFKKAGI